MTNDAQRTAIKEKIKRYTEAVTKTPESAREALIKEGFLSAEGGLTAAYGGGAQKIMNRR